MRGIVYAFAAITALVAAAASTGAGCTSDLGASSPGHDHCDTEGRCAAGYVCNPADKICVPAGSLPDGGTGGHGGAGTGGSGGAPIDGGPDGPDACADTMGDPLNCGTCGVPCPVPVNGVATCADGMCGVSCDADFTVCGSACVDTQTDPSHCNDCDTVCPATQVCAGGVCGCDGTKTLCGATCVDLTADPLHCGDCSKACPVPDHGTATCSTSACGISCDATHSPCDGACVDEDTDVNNCGSCGHPCTTSPPGSMPICVGGLCTGKCVAPGTPDLCPIGCVNELTDAAHCGDCSKACGAPLSGSTTGTPTCLTGSCDVTCKPTLIDCAVNGGQACVNPQTDPQHCGSCAHACTAARRARWAPACPPASPRPARAAGAASTSSRIPATAARAGRSVGSWAWATSARPARAPSAAAPG